MVSISLRIQSDFVVKIDKQQIKSIALQRTSKPQSTLLTSFMLMDGTSCTVIATVIDVLMTYFTEDKSMS